MADLAATDLTYTIDGTFPKALGGYLKRRFKIVFGDAALTYPSGGVPLTKAKLGCPTYIADLTFIDQDDAQGIVWKLDYATLKLRGYIQGIVVGAAGALTVDDFPLDTTAEPLASTVSTSLTNNTGAGTKLLGRLQELTAAASAPAAQTLYCVVEGY